ncbi:MAG: 50S ribosomal protein L11 methyltransferase, partial [Dehalococcoidia bacterium]
MNARQAAREGATLLARAGIEDAAFEAELLARKAGNLDRASYFAGHDLQSAELARFHDLVARRLQREPAAHILGTREFYGLDFDVTPHALVPRPETELLVQIAIRETTAPPLRGRAEGGLGGEVVLDIGTGTGCIAIATALHLPHARIVATDISPAALA